jgi:mannose-6-phosphate isomerase-like protein (cupin superfamily)
MTLPKDFPSDTRLNPHRAPLTVVSVGDVDARVKHPWVNLTLVRVNDSIVSMGALKGDGDWHEHADDDEFFFVVEGQFLIDLEPQADAVTPGKIITLNAREG